VLELVPYFGAGIDAVGSFAAHASFRSELGVHPVVGLDWLLARDFALGLQGRPIFLITAWDRAPIYLSINLNATWLLDL
ncbi:MAG TPA: hypothetical protein VHZ95_16280, partial [Polyangiales bacterium]|nr:hypothetical protein [Polyangiales bacterium]